MEQLSVFLFKQQKEAKAKLLKDYELEQKTFWQDLIWIVLALVCIVLLIKLVINDYLDKGALTWNDAIKNAVPISVAFIVYRQWMAARHEISVDKYYDRIDAGNKRLEVLAASNADKEDLHIFSELDKLEYVIMKYKLGYMLPTLAYRAVSNFQGHCNAKDWFHKRTTELLDKASYLPETKAIATKLCANCTYKNAPAKKA